MSKKIVMGLMAASVLAVSGGALAADKGCKEMAPMAMKEIMQSKMMKVDKDGMITVQQWLDMENERIQGRMKKMGVDSDKMTPAQWEKMYQELYSNG